MALKMKENYQKNVTEAAKQHAASTTNVYINRAGRAVTLANGPITTNNTQQSNQGKLPKDCEDVESMKGKFSWKLINGYHVPYILRIINGDFLKFVSIRMAENQLLSKYLHYLHVDIYKCTFVRCHTITDSEAYILNEINQKHCDSIYGKKMFLAGKDYIVRLDEVQELYTFVEVCYKKLTCNITTGSTEKCGFIRINSAFVVPYCIEDNRKHVPLFFFENPTEILERQAVKLENWNLAYLKFCCRIQGIRDELIPSDSCTVINLDDLKNYFRPETNFEEYWPDKEVYTRFLTNHNSTSVNPPGHRISEPPEVALAENTTHHTLTAPAPVLPPIIPGMMISYQNRWPPNQMVNSYTTHTQPPSTCDYSIAARNQSIAAQCYNASSTMSKGGSLIRDAGHFVLPPTLVSASSAASVIGYTVSYSNVLPISQCVTTMYNPMTNSNVISHSSQMRQFYTEHSNNSQAQQQQLQQQHITNPQTQQSYSGQSVYDRFTNNQQRHKLKNVGSIVIAPPPETVDSPSRPVPSVVQETPVLPNITWELTRIPERMQTHGLYSHPYKIQMVTLQGKMIHSINFTPYKYLNLMVTLDDLVQVLLPRCTVAKCAYVLSKRLRTILFSGNSEQLALLLRNGRIRSMCPNDTPMALLQDVSHVFPQLVNTLVGIAWMEKQMQQYQSAGGPSKRQRTD